MNKKFIGILIVTLLIATAVLPVSSSISENNIIKGQFNDSIETS